MKTWNIIKIITFIGALFGPLSVLALTGATVSLSVSPTNPSPNETVQVSVSALEFNIDLSKISWSVNDKEVKSGVGEKSLSLEAPANGKSTVVAVTVTPPGSLPIEKSLTISPGDIDLIYEVIDGYAPPFYKGKVLPIKQSSVRVVAIPNVKSSTGSVSPSSGFVYTWRKDSENQASQSGFGKDSIFFVNQILDTSNRIDVSASNGLKKVDGSIIVTPFAPEIIFYEDDSDTGVKYQRALQSNLSMKAGRLAIVAEPYYLLKQFKGNSDTVIDWTVNNQKFTAQQKNEIILNTANQTGSMSIGASYNETKRLFRNFAKNISVTIKN